MSYSPTRNSCSTIGAEGLYYCVRNGNRCTPFAIAAGISDSIPVPNFQPNSFAIMTLNRFVLGYLFLIPTKFLDKAARSVSTGRLHTLLYFHLRPIKQFILLRPSGELRSREIYLGAGFPLRCLQRLSIPNLATLRCRWRDNRITIGPSTLVLSY